MISLISIVLALIIEIIGVGLPKYNSAFPATSIEPNASINTNDSHPKILIMNKEEQQEIKST